MKIIEYPFLLSDIDLGTGSLIIQILIGSVAGGLLALKMSWKKIKYWLKGRHSTKEKFEKSPE
jgi:hypothetical protein